MTLREKLGQMLMLYYFGVFTSTESAEYKELLHQVEENHVGGLIVGTQRGPLGIERSQVYPTAVLTNEFQQRAKTSAADRRGFRIRHRHAPRRRHFVPFRHGRRRDRRSASSPTPSAK